MTCPTTQPAPRMLFSSACRYFATAATACSSRIRRTPKTSVSQATQPFPTQRGPRASIDVLVIGSRFDDDGFAGFDRDGLRVDEGAGGNLSVVVSLSTFHHNGADGIELDERGPGNVVFNVSGIKLTANGDFDTTVPIDKDDGMDVDESLGGDLIGKVVASVANDNFEEGWDFNENDAGDFKVDMTLVEASRNVEEGVDFEEDDDFQGGGDLVATLTGLKADGNVGGDGDGGLKIRERGDGLLKATVRGAQTDDNRRLLADTDPQDGINVREQGNGDLQATIERAAARRNGLAGIRVREDDAGSITSTTIDRSTTDDNGSDGIHFDERNAGTLTATASRGNSGDNNGVGVRADQGQGTLDLVAMTFNPANVGGDFFANATVTVTQTP